MIHTTNYFFLVKQHPTGFIGSSGDVVFSAEPDVQDNVRVFRCGSIWGCMAIGWVMGREGIIDTGGEVVNVDMLTFGGAEVYFQIVGPSGTGV